MQQNIRIAPERTGLFLRSPLKMLCVLVFHLLLTHTSSLNGQSQLIGPSQPIVATVGHDIILPCHLKPAVDVADMILEWTRPDLKSVFAYVRRGGQELVQTKHASYKDRTSVFINELKHGNISLKLSAVKPSDEGTYQCHIPTLGKGSSVQLLVESFAVSSPAIDLAGFDKNSSGLVLQCESEGWYPEPEVSWLDGEGHVLSAGPTETVRGPDGLYTVSSRVTVEERHRNSFTCRVQQKDINQIRETQIKISDDLFELQSSSSSSSALTAGLAFSLSACILIILLLVFLVWRQKRIKTKRSNETEKGVKNSSESSDQIDIKEETGLLKTDDSENNTGGKMGNEEKETNKVEDKQAELHEEKQRNEKELKNLKEQLENLKEQLENKNKEVEDKQAELHEEKQRNEEELKNLKEQLEDKNKETKEDLEEAHRQLESKNEEISQLKTQVESLRAEVRTITEMKEKKENECQDLRAELDAKTEPAKDFWHGKEKDELITKIKELEQQNKALHRQSTRKKAHDQLEKNAKISQNQNQNQGDTLTAEVKMLTEEKQSSENNQQLQTELENEKKEWNQTSEEKLERKSEENNQLQTQQESQEQDNTAADIQDP